MVIDARGEVHEMGLGSPKLLHREAEAEGDADEGEGATGAVPAPAQTSTAHLEQGPGAAMNAEVNHLSEPASAAAALVEQRAAGRETTTSTVT